MEISQKAVDLILSFEGLNQPHKWPGGGSGITLGYGYDLGFHTLMEFSRDWQSYLPVDHFTRLVRALGKRGTAAQAMAHSFEDIHIDQNSAMRVFKEQSLPRFVHLAREAFPNFDRLPADAAGALVSLVYNRGPSLNEDDVRRAEMHTIRDILVDGVQRGDLKAIACQLRSMKRLWVGKGLDGLIRRREAEAQLVEGCIL